MKTLIKNILIIFFVLIIIATCWIMLSYKTIKPFIINEEVLSENDKVQESIKEYKVIECKFHLFNPEYAFVDLEHYIYPEDGIDNKSYNIYFSKYLRTNIFSNKWAEEYIGGTTVKNTTFPELVKMVKDDCSQFQEGYGDYYGEDLAWSYSPYESEPEVTLDELEMRDLMWDR